MLTHEEKKFLVNRFFNYIANDDYDGLVTDPFMLLYMDVPINKEQKNDIIKKLKEVIDNAKK